MMKQTKIGSEIMEKMPRQYFAYGSNMNLAQMKQKCLRPKILGIARLPGYKVEFYGYSAIWDGAQETVIPDLESEVWGVLYELSFSDSEQLDVYEDARFDGAGTYFNYPVEVVDSYQTMIDALIYKKNILLEAQLPSTEYLNFIVQGATEQGLPGTYIRLLQNMKTKAASYAVPVIRRSGSSWSSVTCDDCGQ
jgi:hypothetical protein